MKKVAIIGAGLAGSEAAWQLAQRGITVELYEMRPIATSPAHHTDLFAELVCSNSLRAAATENAVGLLKEEMRQLDSIVLQAADANRLPAGGALAVDRTGFSQYITDALSNHPFINVVRREVTEVPSADIVIFASGPLTSPALANCISILTGQDYLYFYDAAAPIISKDSLNMDVMFRASRYDKGEADYLNCPLNKEEYEVFWHSLVGAETTAIKQFEKEVFFEGCMPVEVMAKRGIDTLRFGPLKPVGLINPHTGEQPYAVVQLRQDNVTGTLYNMVGFQTHLKWPEQKRVFGMIPGLGEADFVRYGVMHRNTYINSPIVLKPTLQMKNNEEIYFAGQITGVEGYVESAATGLVAGINAVLQCQELTTVVFPPETTIGALTHYITHADAENFQPMNINFGLIPPLMNKIRIKKLKNQQIAARSLEILHKFKEKFDNIVAE